MKVSGALDRICLRLCFVAEFQAEFQLFQLSPKAGLDAFHENFMIQGEWTNSAEGPKLSIMEILTSEDAWSEIS
jgi:hypothetical protein